MKIQFWQADPNKKAMTQMEQILEHGVDQIAIASAFCTAPGVDFLLKFEKNLHISKKSFVVVAKDYPTDLCALNRLHEVTESVYVHLGCGWLEEKRGVPPLMHSKVILARQGEKCWLWTGSHNLTASAMLGLNCEAAVVVEGPVNNQLFKDALTHLEKCKDQAELYDPRMCEKKVPKILVVHAEAETDIKVPSHVHACFHETTHDRIVKPNTRVALFLYPLHTLHKRIRWSDNKRWHDAT
jgi:HKD family nuclease